MLRFIIITIFLLTAHSGVLFAQHQDNHDSQKEENKHYKNEMALYYGSTYLTKSGFNIPTIGIDYSRKLNSFLSIAVVADLELGSHIIEDEIDGDVSEVKRERALLLLPGLSLRVVKGLVVFAGYGIELEKDESLGLLRMGTGYTLKLKNERWMVDPYLYWEHTKLFEAIGYGLVIGYEFGK